MLRLPRLRFARPRSVSEAVETVASNPGAMLLGGGTDLIPNLKRRQFDASLLVSLGGIAGLDQVEGDEARGLSIGAGATLDQLASHRALAGGFRALAQACADVSTPQIRMMGTIGGNLMVDPRCNYYNQTEHWRKAVG